MIRQIKKQASVFVAILVLLVLALGIGGYILSNQRFYLPKEVPVLGTDFYRVKAEFQTGQAVVPGQGQTVNIAGVSVGDVGKVTLENGRAVIQMNIRAKYKPIYKNATVLLRPKTGLKDMYLSLDPGTKEAGALEEGGRVRVANTLPDVNPDEVLAQLDRDTRDYLRILLNAGGTAFDDESAGNTKSAQPASQDLREAFKRFEPTARDGKKITDLLAKRRNNTKRVIHNFQELATELGDKDKQLAALVDSANANFEAFAQEESSLRDALKEFPPALSQTATTLAKVEDLAGELGPALGGLRPFARNLAPALRETRPFLRETTPIIREQIRPFARDVQPVVRDLRSATKDLAVVTPRLTRTFGVLNKLFNELAYNPPGGAESFLFWGAWAAHNGMLTFNSQDAHGPLLRGTVLVTCKNYVTLGDLIAANEQLGLLTRLLNLPKEREVCPQNPNPRIGEPGYPPATPGAPGTPTAPVTPTAGAASKESSASPAPSADGEASR
ncbi:MAG TPA: MlaD family protein [Thermoleophilaceae bacterium]|nr:MlaD family protein [Thermoleophilaceae bacterium]